GVNNDLPQQFKKGIREFEAAACSFLRSSLAMKWRPLHSERTPLDFVWRGFAVRSVVGTLLEFFSRPTARHLCSPVSWAASISHVMIHLRTMRRLVMQRLESYTDVLCRRRAAPTADNRRRRPAEDEAGSP